MVKHFIFVVFLCLSIFCLAAGKQSGPPHRRAGVISGNRTSTVFGNWGVIGQPCTTGPRGAWLKSTNGYIGDMSILVGVELPIRDYTHDGNPDTIHSVITCPIARPAVTQDVDPITGKMWTFEPVEGYQDASMSTPAISTDPETWPTTWPGHADWGSGVWNGLFGPNTFVGFQETYFRMDDVNDERMYKTYGFLPDTTNPAVKGQGIQVDVRYVQVADPRYQDVIFRIFDITNRSTSIYSKVVLGNLTGTYVGVTGCYDSPQEYDDDASVFFSSNAFIMAEDYGDNARRNPYWQGSVGKFGEAFLQSPGDTIASYDYFTNQANPISLGNDEQLWKMLKPGHVAHPSSIIQDTVVVAGEDGDYTYGSGYFALDTGETRRIVSVISYGPSKDQVLQKILMAKALWNSNFDPIAASSAVAITNFSSHRTLSGAEPIQWSIMGAGGSVDLWFSPDAGQSWKAIGKHIPNTGTYSWNTSAFQDCPFGTLRIFVRDTSGVIYGFSDSPSFFTVSNTSAAAPFVQILDQFSGGDTLTQSMFSMQLLIGDTHSDTLTAKVYYRVSPSDSYVQCETFAVPSDTNPQSHNITLGLLPNADKFSLKLEVSDGTSLDADSTEEFHKLTPRSVIPASNLEVRSGFAEVPVQVRIVDPTKVVPHTYIITIDDTSSWTQKKFSVYDSTDGHYSLLSQLVQSGIESSAFDGLALYTEDTMTRMDSLRTHWNRTVTNLAFYNFSVFDISLSDPVRGYRQPHDYVVTYHDQPVDSSVAVDSFGVAAVPIRFEVYDQTIGKKLKVIYVEWGYGSETVFIEDVAGVNRYTWDLYMSFNPPDTMPREGDTLFIFTKKGLSFYDSFKISGNVLSVNSRRLLPSAYTVSQNYPNPFNPSTTVQYELPASARIRMKIFDILGREVKTLLDEIRPAGSYSATWDGTNTSGLPIASGIYFCRVEMNSLLPSAGSFISVRKMLLLR